ncbi:LIM/homeobox protein Awh-like [Corticium candelabrum]|uniref:LIM/homeobox protein Awh-like n=1 Tax=Corticium candelabrum TaxID=121492 RepID=UPI002E260364|nr:LIM/homeobox protein Awh-like [Corticium candelabrum]XP_062515054.1 LIM/homeobox protein Awh-like [Corticium candelabrum]
MDTAEKSDVDVGGLESSQVCASCGEFIPDRYLLKMDERFWHEKCLRCSACHVNLSDETSCFVKQDRIYCRLDYFKLYGIKCAACLHVILSSDWIRQAHKKFYHLACFSCHLCQRQLSTGEEFVLQNENVICKHHFVDVDTDEDGHNKQQIEEGIVSGSKRRARRHQHHSKRPRTIFSEQQLQVLQRHYNLEPNPDAQELDRIAHSTGLSKRVTQVWFQNNRARHRRHTAELHSQLPKMGYGSNSVSTLRMRPFLLDAALLINRRTAATEQPPNRIIGCCSQCGLTYCHCCRQESDF